MRFNNKGVPVDRRWQ